jgi:uncharacterized membrane-anchored protein
VNRKALAALAFPGLYLLGWCLYLSATIAGGTLVQLRVEGYDPRDLLRGHYIRYRLSQGSASCPSSGAPTYADYCACTQPSSDTLSELYWIGACSEKPSGCTIYLRGDCSSGQFTAGIEEYFIPEEFAPVLQTIPPDSRIVLALDHSGKAHVVSLLVGETPIEEYARGALNQLRTNAPGS